MMTKELLKYLTTLVQLYKYIMIWV